ncbi:MAG: hypothetical protein ACK47B_26405 [Armatimonadota bacterium]
MWYPEEPVTYCERCESDIPADCLWRGKGLIIGADHREVRTPVLYSECPDCGRRLSTGLLGPWWYRVLYGWLWKLRYPQTRRPESFGVAAEPPLKRAAGK